MNKTLRKFPFLGTGEEIRNAYIPDGVGWKEYYIWLSDLALLPDNVLTELAYNNLRLDVELLLGERGKITKGLDLPVFLSNNLLERTFCGV